jgi:hypothetical protein
VAEKWLGPTSVAEKVAGRGMKFLPRRDGGGRGWLMMKTAEKRRGRSKSSKKG